MRRLAELKTALQDVADFAQPELELEQYCTPSDVAAEMLWTAHQSYDDIEDSQVFVALSAAARSISAHLTQHRTARIKHK